MVLLDLIYNVKVSELGTGIERITVQRYLNFMSCFLNGCSKPMFLNFGIIDILGWIFFRIGGLSHALLAHSLAPLTSYQ